MAKKDIDLSFPKAIVHNLTFKGIEVVLGVLDYDQRGIVYARAGDVVVTKNPPGKDFLSYLQSLGWDFTNTKFISPNVGKNYIYNSVFYDKKIISFLKKSKVTYLDTYNSTSEEENFAKRIGLPIYTNCRISSKYGTKSGFRKLAKNLGLKIPRGFETLKTAREVKEAIRKLFNKGINEVIIKIDEGISGAGSTRIGKRAFKKLKPSDQSELVKQAMTKVPQAMKTSGMIVEEWREDVKASPSIQFQIFPDKSFKTFCIQDQLLEGKEQWYIGCLYPSSSLKGRLKKKFIKEAEKFAKALVDKGFIGIFGMDAVLTRGNQIYWVEANVRKPGTFYPRIIAEKLNNDSIRGICYLACDFTIPKFKGKKFNVLKDYLKKHLWDGKKKEGIVLYNVGALKDGGRFDLVCLGREKTEVKNLYKSVRNKLDKLKGNP